MMPYVDQYQMPRQPQQIQNGGFIMVRCESEARNYPVAHGNSVTFFNENGREVYTKTLGFSQFEAPIFEIYDLIKRSNEQQIENDTTYATKDDLTAILDDIKALKKEVFKMNVADNEKKRSDKNA